MPRSLYDLISATVSVEARYTGMIYHAAMEDLYHAQCEYDEKRINGTLTDMDRPPDPRRYKAEPRPINDPEFEAFWESYDYKVGRDVAHRAWKRLHPMDREKARQRAALYAASTPDKKYRKHPSTWLNQRGWEDEIIDRRHKPETPLPQRTTGWNEYKPE